MSTGGYPRLSRPKPERLFGTSMAEFSSKQHEPSKMQTRYSPFLKQRALGEISGIKQFFTPMKHSDLPAGEMREDDDSTTKPNFG